MSNLADADDTAALTPKAASTYTQAANDAVVVSFDDATDFEAARRGLVAQHETGHITTDDGRNVWNTAIHEFLRTGASAPDTVHPGLWRQGELNAIHGLFEVADGVWQARGYDLSNITFMAGDDGWVIIDPLTVEQTAKACLDLANATLGERPVTAVIYTHSHVDHFGGVLGVTTPEAVDAGDVRIIAPDGFLAEAVSEAGTAGPIMTRRAHYQFGPLLPPGPTGIVNAGLGMGVPGGFSSIIAPTETIVETGTELTIDGIRVVFQNTPDAEAPSEMNFFFPDSHLLCMAENCCHTLHNLYPIRGAQTRDALAWSKYINEALLLWGDDTDIMFASHHWPRFGGDDVRAFLRLQRDVYRWMHDQTVRFANRGYTPDEIAAHLEMPGEFAGQSHVQGYYGTVSHNVRSVYNRYLGWYDGNPANLHPLPPVDAGERYVELMGGAEKVIAAAQQSFDAGEYRWVAQLLNHVIFADPDNGAARRLSADAMEQLGYQAESSTWRNAYLTAALELRHGSIDLGFARPLAVGAGLSGEQLVEMIGVRFAPESFRDEASVALVVADRDEAHLVGVANRAVHHRELDAASVAHDANLDAVVVADHAVLVDVITRGDRYGELVSEGSLQIAHGDEAVVAELIGALDVFGTPKVIEPNPPLG